MLPSELTAAVTAPMISNTVMLHERTAHGDQAGMAAGSSLLALHMHLQSSIPALTVVTSAKQCLGLTLSLNGFPHSMACKHCPADRAKASCDPLPRVSSFRH